MSTISEIHIAADRAFPEAIDRSQVAVIIPTCNAREHWAAFTAGLRRQGLPAKQILVIDSSSGDGTRELAAAEGYQVLRIDRESFNHGGTRQLGLGCVPWARIVVYLTQDAILATPQSIDLLLSAFEDTHVGTAYGRQLPRPVAGPIEAHARIFNYPPQSDVRDFASRSRLGIKAVFSSNSFAAYRVSALREVGGFPSDVIFGEDTLVAGKLLLAGWKNAYVAEAQVYHSHGFTLAQEFHRYFDIGVLHHRESWLQDRFGRAGGEGKRFVVSELRYLLHHAPQLLPVALLRSVSKAIGYELGLREGRLGKEWSKKLSYHKEFWDRPASVSKPLSKERSTSELSSSEPAHPR